MTKVAHPGNMVGFGINSETGERTIFGSNTVSDLLSANLTTEFQRGWGAGVNSNGFPTMEFFNALGFTLSQAITLLYQRGVAPWSETQEYYHPALVMGSDGAIYKSIADSTGEDPTTDDGTYWSGIPDTVTTPNGAFKNIVGYSAGSAVDFAYDIDQIVLKTSSGSPILLTGLNLTGDTSASGAGGLDTGSIAADTFYAVFVIHDGTNTNLLLSLSATAPTLPSGYTYFARIGWILTDSSTYPTAFDQNDKFVRLRSEVILAIGVDAGTTVDIDDLVPSTVKTVHVHVLIGSSGTNAGGVTLQQTSSGGAGIYAYAENAASTGQHNNGSLILSYGLRSFYYISEVNVGQANLTGWEDNL